MAVSGGKFEDISTIEPSAQKLDPFWATRLWQQLIKEVLSKVQVSRQRQYLKLYDHVFNGVELVDVVFQFLKECPSHIISDQIERTNAVKVCQALMESKLFENVITKVNTKFEDSSHRLYRFLGDKGSEPNKIYKEDKENYRLNISNAEESKDSSPFLNENYTQRDTSIEGVEYLSLESLDSYPKRKSFYARKSLRLPLSKLKSKKQCPVGPVKRNIHKCNLLSQNFLNPTREDALAQLLIFVEIPILESILSIPHDLPEVAEHSERIIENTLKLTKVSWPRPMSKDFMEIPLVRATAACLSRTPPGVTKLWSIQSCKIHCYQSVVERFSKNTESLIPAEYVSVCTSIVDMLKHEEREKAIHVLQLFMIVIPWNRRIQLQNLLKFLFMAIEDIFVSFDRKITNYEAVSRDFLPVVFNHPLVDEKYRQILFDFMIFKVNKIFQLPQSLQRNLSISFCNKQSTNDHEALKSQYTKKCLEELASSVMDSISIKLPEKKIWAKKLKKHHLQVYETCFST